MKIFKYVISAVFLILAVAYVSKVLVPSAFLSFLMALALSLVFYKAEIEIEPKVKKFFTK